MHRRQLAEERSQGRKTQVVQPPQPYVWLSKEAVVGTEQKDQRQPAGAAGR